MATTPVGKTMAPMAEGASYRQHTRLLLAIQVTVIGKDSAGRPRQEDTKTVDVGKRGARIPLLLAPAANAGIGVRGAAGGDAHAARVVWRGKKKDLDGRTEIGVEFLRPFDAERLWAIPSPPEDWQDGQLSLTAMEKLDLITERSMVPGRSREDFVALAETAPSAETNAEWPAEPQPIIHSEPIINGQGEARNEAPLNAPAAHLPSSPASELAARLAEILAERANASLPVAQDAAGPVQAAARKAVEDLQAARKQIEEGLRTSAQLYQKELLAFGDASGERLRGSSQRLVATFRDELQKALDELDKKAEAVGTVEGAEQDAVAKLQNLGHDMESSLFAAYAEHQKQLAALGASSLRDLSQKSQTMLAGFEEELGKAQRRLEDTATGAVEHKFERLAADLKGDLAVLGREQERRMIALREQMEDHVRDSVNAVKPPPPFNPRTLLPPVVWTLVAVAALSVVLFFSFVYGSTVRVWRLHPSPPDEFARPDASWNASRAAAEQVLAEGYWNEAVRTFQQVYPFGTDLPEQPPPDFWVDPRRIGDVRMRANAEASRLRYWQILRKVWSDPRNWDESYEWSSKWLGSRLEPLGEALRKLGQ